jgi:hypothetical protein
LDHQPEFTRPKDVGGVEAEAELYFPRILSFGRFPLHESSEFDGRAAAAARILAALMAGRQPISNQYENVGSSWGGVMFDLVNKDLML